MVDKVAELSYLGGEIAVIVYCYGEEQPVLCSVLATSHWFTNQ